MPSIKRNSPVNSTSSSVVLVSIFFLVCSASNQQRSLLWLLHRYVLRFIFCSLYAKQEILLFASFEIELISLLTGFAIGIRLLHQDLYSTRMGCCCFFLLLLLVFYFSLFTWHVVYSKPVRVISYTMLSILIQLDVYFCACHDSLTILPAIAFIYVYSNCCLLLVLSYVFLFLAPVCVISVCCSSLVVRLLFFFLHFACANYLYLYPIFCLLQSYIHSPPLPPISNRISFNFAIANKHCIRTRNNTIYLIPYILCNSSHSLELLSI